MNNIRIVTVLSVYDYSTIYMWQVDCNTTKMDVENHIRVIEGRDTDDKMLIYEINFRYLSSMDK